MRTNIKYILGITIITLLMILFNQIIWIYRMYTSYKQELLSSVNHTIEKSVYMELFERTEHMGGEFTLWFANTVADTNRYVQKKVTTADTTVYVPFDKQDPHARDKILQLVLKDDISLNINKLNAIFKGQMAKGKFLLKETYIDYIDLQKNQMIQSNKPKGFNSSFIASDTLCIDALNSLGIRAYIVNPTYVILKKMVFQIILSAILMVIAFFCMFFLIRYIIVQKKEEKMRRDAISSMVHELKRPVSGVTSLMQMIPRYLEKNMEGKIKEYTGHALLELNKLTAYIQRIQQISNNEKETIHLNPSEIELAPFIESLRERYDQPEEHKQVIFNADIRTPRTTFQADLLHFSNVMDNLVENALKYSGESVHITVTVTDDDRVFKFSVKDNGFGISGVDKNYIFDRYYRSKDREVQRKAGFGLGLTYVKTIIEEHRGNVEVNSEPGKGSEFTVYLPA